MPSQTSRLGPLLGLFLAPLTVAVPVCAQTNVHVTINAAQTGAMLPPMGIGVNTAVWDGSLPDADVPHLLRQAHVTALRFPGGSTSDVYHWQNNTATSGTHQSFNPGDTFDDFMAIAKNTGASPIITVNYGSNAAGNAGGDPAEAAAWVHYANIVKHDNVKYWEIGNEIYGNGEYGAKWEEDLHPSHTPTTYGQNVAAFAQAMKAQDPTIKIGAVLTAPGNWPDGQKPDWNTHVLAQCGSSIGFVIIHWYPQNPGQESDAGLLGSTASIASMVSHARALIHTYCGANAPHIPIFVTETNSVSSKPGKQTVSLVNALFAADDVMQWLENGVANVDWWALHNGPTTNGNNSGSLYGTATFGDYGILSNGSPPEPAADTPFPADRAFQILGALDKPGDTFVSSVSSQPQIAVYAAKETGGSLALLLINKDPQNSDSVHVAVTGYQPSGKATSQFYGENSSVLTTSTLATGQTFTVTAPPYSLTTVILTPRH